MKISLKAVPFLKEIASLIPPGQEVYIVGGAVRDIALGRRAGDIDLVTSGGAAELAARLAERLGGTAFVLDPARDVRRVVVKSDVPSQLDVSPLKGDIETDLAARDFTINAMAIPLSPHLPGRGDKIPPSPLCQRGAREDSGARVNIIDPFGGIHDLAARLIRALGRDVFISDPLRLLRAFRLAGQLGFRVEEGTLSLITGLAPHINSVSAERVRDELYMILEGGDAAGIFREMANAGLLREIIPETGPMAGLPQGAPHSFDLLEHSLRTMEHAERVMDDLERYFGGRSAEAGERLQLPVDGGLRMSGLIKLCALLHDEEGAMINARVADRLKLSDRAAKALAATAKGHMRPLHMSRGPYTRHAVYRYVRDMADDLVASLVVAMADALATRERPGSFETDVEGVVKAVAEYYFGQYAAERAEPLVSGHDLIDLFGLAPGPAFKRILDAVDEGRGSGTIPDRAAALAYVKENLARFLCGVI